MKFFPTMFTLFLLKILFFLFGYKLGIRKLIIIRQLKLCFPEKSDIEIKILTKKIYSELAITVAEVFIFNEKYFQDKIELINFEEVKKALSLNRGVIIVSAHFSNWEMGAKILAKEYSEVYGVVKKQRNSLFNTYIDQKRQLAGIKTIEMKNALKNIISALNKNKVVAFLVDQYASNQGTEIDFMGHKTMVYTSVAQIGLKFNTPIIVAFDVRDENGKHKVIFHNALFFGQSQNIGFPKSNNPQKVKELSIVSQVKNMQAQSQNGEEIDNDYPKNHDFQGSLNSISEGVDNIPPAKDLEAKKQKNEVLVDKTKEINSLIEEYIKKYPHLWFWVHRKWRNICG